MYSWTRMMIIRKLLMVLTLLSLRRAATTTTVGIQVERDSNYPNIHSTDRVAIFTNPSGVFPDTLEHFVDVLHKRATRIQLILAPEHGFRGDRQAESGDPDSYIDQVTGLNVSSVYKKDSTFIRSKLDNVTKVLVDIQDCGVRLYTFIWSLYDVMNAAPEHVSFVVFDRPNPLGGEIVNGPILESKLYSRYGRASIPHRHGLTIGELAQLFAHDMKKKLTVVKMKNWKRSYLWEQTNLPFIPPSPNLPTPRSIRHYVSTVFLEATTISEGRGTTTPFSTFGAPWFSIGSEAFDLTRRLNEKCCKNNNVSSSCFRTSYYIPTWFKYNGTVVGGVEWMNDDDNDSSFAKASELLITLMRSSKNGKFRWDGSWFGWGSNSTLIDLYAGTARYRNALMREGATGVEVSNLFRNESDYFASVTRVPYLLY